MVDFDIILMRKTSPTATFLASQGHGRSPSASHKLRQALTFQPGALKSSLTDSLTCQEPSVKSTISIKKSTELVRRAQEACRRSPIKASNSKTSVTTRGSPSILSTLQEKGTLINSSALFEKLGLKCKSQELITNRPPSPSRQTQEAPPSTKDSPIDLKKVEINMMEHLDQARQLQSFCIDEDEEESVQISFVEQTGLSILNWGACTGKSSEFRIIKFLDQGRFGKVYLAQSLQNNLIYSVKSLYRSTMTASLISQFAREVTIQSYLSHPHIVQLHHYSVEEDSAYLFMEPCLGGNLYQQLKKHGKINEPIVREWIRQVCHAVEYMHSENVIHRDIKPQNILLHQGMIKLCDFGWAVYAPTLRGTKCGTPLYVSPQIVQGSSYDTKVDIWSLGVLAYELLHGNIPFEIRNNADLSKIVEQEVYISRNSGISEDAREFMFECLKKNPEQRPTASQLLRHPWLQTERRKLTL